MKMYQIRALGQDDLPQLTRLHKRVIRHIGGKKDLLIVERDGAYFLEILSELGIVVGAFFGKDLVGYSSLRYPQIGEENFGTYAGLPISEFPFLAHSNGSMVDPGHRGHGLHRAMAGRRTQTARALGLRHLLSEVHGSNPPSLRNLFALGFKIRGTKHEDGDDFLIFHQQLSHSSSSIKYKADALAIDTQRQRKLLADGLVGYEINESNGHCSIKYGLTVQDGSMSSIGEQN